MLLKHLDEIVPNMLMSTTTRKAKVEEILRMEKRVRAKSSVFDDLAESWLRSGVMILHFNKKK